MDVNLDLFSWIINYLQRIMIIAEGSRHMSADFTIDRKINIVKIWMILVIYNNYHENIGYGEALEKEMLFVELFKRK